MGTHRDGVTVNRSFDPENKDPSRVILEGLAEIKNTTPPKLDLQLYDYVDKKALNTIVTQNPDVTVVLTIDGCSITVSGGEVVIALE
ncbi:HalOD1 output domain-containing protein [Halosimplex carlsbadense]|uniref:HalOD1 output domain-containing protein n=1 Tax=Halosimplex carlsbadense TaxID=171164 RepID=UPI0013764E1C